MFSASRKNTLNVVNSMPSASENSAMIAVATTTASSCLAPGCHPVRKHASSRMTSCGTKWIIATSRLDTGNTCRGR